MHPPSGPNKQDVQEFPERFKKEQERADDKLKDLSDKKQEVQDLAQELTKAEKDLQDKEKVLETARENLKKAKEAYLKDKTNPKLKKDLEDAVGKLKDASSEVGDAKDAVQDTGKKKSRASDELAKLELLPKKLTRKEELFKVSYCHDKSKPHVEHGGPCSKCGKEHSLERNNYAVQQVAQLHQDLKKLTGPAQDAIKTLPPDTDISSTKGQKAFRDALEKVLTDPKRTDEPKTLKKAEEMAGALGMDLTGIGDLAGGSMLGVMICADENGNLVPMRTFSGSASVKNGQTFWTHPAKITGGAKSVDGTTRQYSDVEKEGVEAPAGNCAAQKLIEAAVEKNQELKKQFPNAQPPKVLIPVAIAEMWIGEGNQGWPEKKDGVMYESCLTCRSLLGDVMCGVDKMKQDNANAVSTAQQKMA